jgi:hypothetical protein
MHKRPAPFRIYRVAFRASDRADGSMTVVNWLSILATQAGLGAKGSLLAGSPSAYLNQVFFRVKRLDHMVSGNHNGTSSSRKSKPPKLDQR